MGRNTRGSYLTLPVLSGSMMPYLRPGGKIRIQAAAADRCHLGDIIVFRGSDGLIAHRLLLRLRLGHRRYLYQKGDAAAIGHWVQEEQMVGVVTKSLDANGAHLYLRSERCREAGHSIYIHLFRDVLARARSAIKALAAYSDGKRRTTA